MDHKIAKIVCLSVIGDTLSQENYNNLHLLATRAREWTVAQFDELCDVLTSELELKIPPPTQRFVSKRAGATVVEVAGSHAVYVSQADAVAGLIAKAAREVAHLG